MFYQRCILNLLLFVLLIIIIYITSKNEKKESLYSTNNEKQILIWDPKPYPEFGQRWWWDYIFKRIINRQCPENRCTITYNRNEYQSADAVIFPVHTMIYHNQIQVPKTHPADQLWVLYSVESYTSRALKDRKALMSSVLGAGYNWIMHYRKDADVEMPYGTYKEIDAHKTTKDNNNSDFWSMKNKTKMACWMVSHCKTYSNRETYAAELSKYMNVDIYGKCGKLKCGCSQIEKSSKGAACPMTDCTEVVNSYFFDLAFENNMCKDYASERLWRSLYHNVIPVVLGGANYKVITPPHSVIDAMDFQSPKLLADYLMKVASDPVLYNKYFEWKSHYEIDLGHPYSTMTCNLCAKLHQYGSKTGSVPPSKNLSAYLENDGCVTWKERLQNKFTPR